MCRVSTVVGRLVRRAAAPSAWSSPCAASSGAELLERCFDVLADFRPSLLRAVVQVALDPLPGDVRGAHQPALGELQIGLELGLLDAEHRATDPPAPGSVTGVSSRST
jgi:hypothetical protein